MGLLLAAGTGALAGIAVAETVGGIGVAVVGTAFAVKTTEDSCDWRITWCCRLWHQSSCSRLVMSDPFKKLVRGLLREAIIASSPPKPKKTKKKKTAKTKTKRSQNTYIYGIDSC